MRKLIVFFLSLFVFILAGCSTFVQDLNKLSSGTKYTVRHMKESVREYDRDGNLLGDPDYETDVETEVLVGKEGTETKAVAKKYEGFEALAFEQKTIDPESGDIIVEIKYDRVDSTITYSLDGGKWDYWANKEKTVEGSRNNPTDITITRKYGSIVPKIDDTYIGKKLSDFLGWERTGDPNTLLTTDELCTTFPAKSVTYTARWENNGQGVKYLILHCLENADQEGYDEVNAQVVESYGEIGEYTEATAKTLEGFTSPTAEEIAEAQRKIADPSDADKQTIVKLYYKRNLYTLTLKAGTGEFQGNPVSAYWNFDAYKAGAAGDSTDKTVTAKYGAKINYEANPLKTDLASIGMMGNSLVSWKSGVIESLPDRMPLNGAEYTATWAPKGAVTVKVKVLQRSVKSYALGKNWADLTEEEKGTARTEEEYLYDEVTRDGKDCYDTTQLLPDTLTNIEAYNFTGFTLEKPVEQQMVKDDGTTVVKIYYERNLVTVTFDTNGGIWDYEAFKQTGNNTSKTVTGRYGLPLVKPDCSTLGRVTYKLNGWKNGDSLVEIPAVIPAEDVTFKADWAKNDGIKYTIYHNFQNTALNGYNHVIEHDDTTKTGTAEVVPTVNPLTTITGFTYNAERTGAIPEINPDGSTVINLYYDRNVYNVTYQINGGLWDYKTTKGDSVDKEFTAAFGTAVPTPDVTLMGQSRNKFIGWKSGTKTVQTSDIIQLTMPANDLVYVAQWEETDGDPYTVRHLRRTVASYVKAWSNLTEQEKTATGKTEETYTYDIDVETLFGDVGNMTTAAQKNYGAGFELDKDNNALDAGGNAVITQKTIESDDKTVVNIYYSRKTFKTTYSLDGGSWDYTINKSEGNKRDDERRTIYEREIDKPSFADIGKQSMKLAGWKLEGNGSLIATEDLPVIQPAADVTYVAVWTENNVSYKVEYYLQNLDDNEYTKDESKTENLTGLAETTTNVTASPIPGFTVSLPITQKTIGTDGKTVVQVYYTRNTYNVSYDINGGVWNYSQVLAGEIEDSAAKTYTTVKYGAPLPKPVMNDMYKVKYVFQGWTTKTNGAVISTADLPETVDAADVTFTAKWTARGKINYTVKHVFQGITSDDYVADANYADDTLNGEEGDLTKAVSKKKTVTGFVAETPEEKPITVEGTVVEIKYNRVVTKVTWDLTGGMWNIEAYRADKALVAPDTQNFVSNKRYGAVVQTPSFNDVGKAHSTFKGWYRNGVTTKLVPLTGPFEENHGLEDVTYTAVWDVSGGVEYKVKHSFENVDGSYSVNEALTQTLLGDWEEPDNMTDAVALSGDVITGFVAQPVTQTVVQRDGSTVVTIKYDRKMVNFIFEGNGGSWGSETTKTISGKYGTAFDASSLAAPSKAGWSFGGWTTYQGEPDATYGTEDKTFTAYWVGSVQIAQPTSLGDIQLTVTPGTKEVIVSATVPGTTDASRWTYEWYVNGTKVALTTAAGNISVASGRKLTVTVKAVYTRLDGTKDPARTKTVNVIAN